MPLPVLQRQAPEFMTILNDGRMSETVRLRHDLQLARQIDREKAAEIGC